MLSFMCSREPTFSFMCSKTHTFLHVLKNLKTFLHMLKNFHVFKKIPSCACEATTDACTICHSPSLYSNKVCPTCEHVDVFFCRCYLRIADRNRDNRI